MGNIVGVALNKVNEGISWLVCLISRWMNSSFNTLKEAFAWVISKIKKFFRYLSNWINKSLNHIRRFLDNFSEKFKEALLKFKKMIDITMEKAANIMSSIGSWSHSSSNELKDLATSLVENLKELFGYVKKYMNLVSKAAKKIGRRFTMPSGIVDILFQLCWIFLREWPEWVREALDGFFKRNFASLAEDEAKELCWSIYVLCSPEYLDNFLLAFV